MRVLLNNIIIIVALISTNMIPVIAQRGTVSPYSRYGIGEITHKGFGRSKAMGNISFGTRDPYHINLVNPASYTARDSLSFLFDLGVSGSTTILETESNSNVISSANIDHLALSFPITKWIAFSGGLVPFSSMGYDIKEESSLNTQRIKTSYKGSGQVNQFYVGTSFQFFNNLSVGANFSYLFGALNKSTSVSFPDDVAYTSEINNNLYIGGLYYSFGLQFYNEINEKIDYTIGLAYEPTVDLNTTSVQNKFIRYPFDLDKLDTVQYKESEISTSLPSNFGVGFVFDFDKRIIFGADYSFQNWKSVTTGDSLVNTWQLRAGLEITPNPTALRGYFNKAHYRIGGYFNNSYLKIGDEQINEYGLTLGIGLPFGNRKSSANISFDIGQRGTLDNNLIKETYIIWTLNLTLFDYWFFQPKID